MKIKRLRSVCHSIAHHAVSGLSYIHPHVLTAARSASLDQLTVDLLDPEPCPEQFRDVKPLLVSLRGLRSKFETILTSEGMALSELEVASLSFAPDPAFEDDHCAICQATLVPPGGNGVRCAVNCLGEMLAPNNALQATRETRAPER
jgi:hypothetical protein